MTGQSRRPRRLAAVLWKGVVGGAEVYNIALAGVMRELGADVTIVFIGEPMSLVPRLAAEHMPYRALGHRRGRDVLRHPRRFAAAVAGAGPDGALLASCGMMGAALRSGGYRAPIVAVEHGELFKARSLNRVQQGLWRLARSAGAHANDIEIAVSDFTLEQLMKLPHAGEQVRVYNGIDASQYLATPEVKSPRAAADVPVVGFAGRLIAGKGADYLIEAIARVRRDDGVLLRIAGDGPERPRLEALVRELGLGEAVSFLGWCDDVRGFWAECDVAAVPSAEFVESCPMTLLEAMACGKPVVATRNGGLPELVADGETGVLASPGDAVGLAEALRGYVRSDARRQAHGAAGRTLVERRFRIRDCAEAYLALFDELCATRRL